MTIQEINKAYDRIIGSLDNKELKNAFDSVQNLIAGSRIYSLEDRLNELQDTYKYMLRYRIEGAKDPMQEQIYNNLISSCYELADQLKIKALYRDSPLIYYSIRRIMEKEQMSYEQLHMILNKSSLTKIKTANGDITEQKQLESATLMLFNKIWTSNFLNSEEISQIREILIDSNLSPIISCQVVSALMMGLQFAFDKEKLFLLFDAADILEEEIRYRALIGILLTLYTYRKRTALYPQITNRLDALSESFPGLSKAIRTITIRFILARETEKINRRINDEIMPDLIKMGKLSDKINLKDLNPDMLNSDMNPEWKEILSDDKIGKKMKELGELQEEGADLMLSTFVYLKKFPFFRELGNWFLPFTTQHSDFSQLMSNNKSIKDLFESMAGSPVMCNSDKYSFYLSMLELPEASRKMMLGQFNDEALEMIADSREDMIIKHGKMEIICRQYIQDLYRFFKLFPAHLDFDDIFTFPLDFHNLPILQPYINDEECLTTIAEYYLRKNYFQEALTVYDRLKETSVENTIVLQKIGYCKQMNDDIKGALKAYIHADLLQPNSKWVIRHIATCYRSLKQPEEALKYYHRYESINPNDLSIQLTIGHCHLELKNYSEALKYYYKVDYLDPDSRKAWRPIAWCSFLTGKYDQARNYYKKIIDNKPNTQDFLNAGHTEWALQNIKGALGYYKKSVEKEGGDFLKFQEKFNQDVPDLIVAGIEESEVPLMLDQLRYSIDDAF